MRGKVVLRAAVVTGGIDAMYVIVQQAGVSRAKLGEVASGFAGEGGFGKEDRWGMFV